MTQLAYCGRCKTVHPWPRCTSRARNAPWSPNRDTAAHARFARAVKKRDGHRCAECGATEDLRAAHTVPIAEGGGYDPSNGRTLCATCDRATDPHAR